MLRERFGLYTDATCPAGTSKIPGIQMSPNVCRAGDSGPLSAATCPAGSTVYGVLTSSYQSAVICVPAGTAVYTPRTVSSPTDWPCNAAGDYFGSAVATPTNSDYKCIPASPGSSSAAAASSSSSSSSSGDSPLDTLSTQYATLKTQYATIAAEVLADPSKMSQRLPQLQALNQEIASVLDQMLRALQYARQSPNSDAYRDELVATLGRIQTDYNGLKTNTDALETLRRIRGAQDESWRGPLFVYLMAFLAAAILLVLVIVLRRQKSDSTIAPATSPSAIPPLT